MQTYPIAMMCIQTESKKSVFYYLFKKSEYWWVLRLCQSVIGDGQGEELFKKRPEIGFVDILSDSGPTKLKYLYLLLWA